MRHPGKWLQLIGKKDDFHTLVAFQSIPTGKLDVKILGIIVGLTVLAVYNGAP
jgi:hypothetical protein